MAVNNLTIHVVELSLRQYFVIIYKIIANIIIMRDPCQDNIERCALDV